MASTAGSDINSRKCAHPPSASVQVQQDGSGIMKKIAHVFEDFTKSFTASTQAQIASTSQHTELNDIHFLHTTRATWLHKTLKDLEQAKASAVVGMIIFKLM
ncbi:hypothetical protein PAXRUDRAFT_18710 [Paxillus rubicundulus Ve08.2h10]|uniref:Uncharacterized protein n=1 Tax=Paxillus rubicundulus Ve08.2h10 TaxID=930991 RepID=A0A0D0D6I3_9AGAM|nr:hypothetical protein PAXRUDRAFT_18710 [Paxillus rubicundulus Ve08.2h10]